MHILESLGKSEEREEQPAKSHQLDRTFVIGNTASGKSRLSRRWGEKLSSDIIDLDQLHWIDGDYSRKEESQVAIAKTLE